MKEIFVFGAGASHASAGTPLGKDLVWKYIQVEEDRDRLEDLFCFVRSKPELKKYVVPLRRMLNTGYLEVLQVDKEHNIDELMKDLHKEVNSESVRLIKRLAVKHIVESRNGRGNALYREFGKRMSGKSASDVCIISLNFDCWLREEFKENNVYKKVCFDYLLKFQNIDPSRKFYKNNQGRGIPLIKLNGSMDWAFNRKTEKIKLLHRDIRATDYFSEEKQDDGVEPHIFLPYQQKDELMKPLWERAKKELRGAEKITIIGYSFPCYDKDIIKLFVENVGSGVKLEVVDYVDDRERPQRKEKRRNEIQDRYKEEKLFFKNDIKFNFDGFERYMDAMQ